MKGKVRYTNSQQGPVLIFSLLDRQPSGDISHKTSSRMPLLSAWPTVIFPASARRCTWPVLIYTG